MDTFEKELDIARLAARRAGEIALRYWGKGIEAEKKSDASPVTIADRECEQLVARVLNEAFPDDGVLGEEGAQKQPRSGRLWIIDPIDGTRDFVRGNPAWATLIGLERDGEVIAGICYLPAMEEMFSATRQNGAVLNERPIRVSKITHPSEAVVCVNGLNAVNQYAFAPRLLDWLEQFWAVRSLGGCLDAMMVARGQADLWIELSGKPWDFAALKIIVEEAGGRFLNFDGRSSIYGGNCIICTPNLESEARRLLQG